MKFTMLFFFLLGKHLNFLLILLFWSNVEDIFLQKKKQKLTAIIESSSVTLKNFQ